MIFHNNLKKFEKGDNLTGEITLVIKFKLMSFDGLLI